MAPLRARVCRGAGKCLRAREPQLLPSMHSRMGAGGDTNRYQEGVVWEVPSEKMPMEPGAGPAAPASSFHRRQHGQSENPVRGGRPVTGGPCLYGE